MAHVAGGSRCLLEKIVLDKGEVASTIRKIVVRPSVAAETVRVPSRVPVVPYLDIIGAIGRIAGPPDIVKCIVVNEAEKITQLGVDSNVYLARNGVKIIVVEAKAA